MKKLRLIFAVMISKLVFLMCGIFKFRGSTTPGKFALKIYPFFIADMSKKVKNKTIIVCGTNGKTTTNNLINSALINSGYKTVCNNAGANMLTGIAAAFSKSATLFGNLNADFACLEIDEANMPLVLRYVTPDCIAVTNLFRDQLDRYGEIDITANLLKKSFLLAPKAQLILNADDPVTSVFENSKINIYYGISENPHMLCCREIRDGSNCAKCGEPLSYEYYNYGQLGKYSCPKCGYENPAARYNASGIKISDGNLTFNINKEKKTVCKISSRVTGLYNVYNMLAAYSILDILKIDTKIIENTISAQKPEPGRMSRFYIQGKCIYLILSKNPTGFNQSVTTVINDSRAKDICLILNDNAQDGIDISWIYDVDFETLITTNAHSYTITGTRKYDMYLRLKYAGCGESFLQTADSVKDAVLKMLSGKESICYVLVNYTAMYPAYLILTALEKEDGKNG